jgi:hypothetical protein
MTAVGPATESVHPGVPSGAIVELRQYTLRPGQREALINLFDREFVETQEAVGMTVIGQFRDLDRPDMFVWLRGFSDMPARAASLTAFYSGAIWRAHAEEANRTMVDSDNVLLLEPVSPKTVFSPGPRPIGGAFTDTGLIVTTIYYPRAGTREFSAFFAQSVRPLVAASGAAILGEYAASVQPNNFPRLPIREGEDVFVWFAVFKSPTDYEQHHTSLGNTPAWRRIAPQLEAQLARPTETLRLVPTSRSRLPR